MKGYTIQNSIDLLEKAVENGGGGGSTSATNVSYDNTSSGLSSSNVQGAIDELDTSVDSLNMAITGITGRFDYSTTEKIIGKWVDGRDLYKKSYVLESAVTVSHSAFTKFTALTIPENLEHIIYGEIWRNGQPGFVVCDVTDVTADNVTNIGAQCAGAYDVTMSIGSVVTIVYVKTAPVANTRKKSSK